MSLRLTLSILKTYFLQPLMAFQIWKKSSQKTKDELASLKIRLETSTYEEDILEALEKIYSLCFEDLNLVGDICFESVVKSLKFTEDFTIQIKILQMLSITNLQKRIEALKKPELRTILLSKPPLFISIFIKLFYSDDLIKFLVLEPNFTEVVIALTKLGYFHEITIFIKSQSTIKETLVFEGIIENLFEATRQNLNASQEAFYILLREILIDSQKNQYYLISNCLEMLNYTKAMIETLECSLDSTSKYFPEIQSKLWSSELVSKALDLRNYKILYLLIHRNHSNFQEFVEKFLNLKNLILDLDRDISAFKIFEYIVRCTTITIEMTESFRINTLLFSLGYDYKDQKLISNMTVDQVIYMIFTVSNLSEIEISIDPNAYDEPISSFLILLNLIHENKLQISQSQILDRLDYLRKLLVNKDLTLDTLRDQLIATINQILIEKSSFLEKKSYSVFEPKSIVKQELKSSENLNGDHKKLYEEVKSNILGIFEKFKQKNTIDKKNFDL